MILQSPFVLEAVNSFSERHSESISAVSDRLRTKWLVTERGWYERRVHSDF